MNAFWRPAVAALLVHLRVEHSLSQQAAADATGVSQPQWSRYERGAALPDLEVLLNVSKWARVGGGVATMVATVQLLADYLAMTRPRAGFAEARAHLTADAGGGSAGPDSLVGAHLRQREAAFDWSAFTWHAYDGPPVGPQDPGDMTSVDPTGTPPDPRPRPTPPPQEAM